MSTVDNKAKKLQMMEYYNKRLVSEFRRIIFYVSLGKLL